MTLGELIKVLETKDPDFVVCHGFMIPHSYKGNYSQLAFRPQRLISIGMMLAEARSAVGAWFKGWTDGKYEMSESTEVFIANHGECGEQIGPILLEYMFAGASDVDPEMNENVCKEALQEVKEIFDFDREQEKYRKKIWNNACEVIADERNLSGLSALWLEKQYEKKES